MIDSDPVFLLYIAGFSLADVCVYNGKNLEETNSFSFSISFPPYNCDGFDYLVVEIKGQVYSRRFHVA